MARLAATGGEFWIVTVAEFTAVPLAVPSRGVTVNRHVCPLASLEGGTESRLRRDMSSLPLRNHATTEPDCASPSTSE
jgi:hypothetical protein